VNRPGTWRLESADKAVPGSGDCWYSKPGLSADDHETTTTIRYYTELGQPRTDEHGAPVPPDMLKRLS
jgi:hypothetical protein